MQLRLDRDDVRPDRWTLGTLSVVDEALQSRERLCYTQEPPLRTDGLIIPCEGALPPGNYNLSFSHCKRFHRILPLIASTPNTQERRRAADRLGMRIHPGHPEPSTGAELMLGLRRADGKVTNTQPAFKRVMERLEAAIARGEAVDVLIA